MIAVAVLPSLRPSSSTASTVIDDDDALTAHVDDDVGDRLAAVDRRDGAGEAVSGAEFHGFSFSLPWSGIVPMAVDLKDAVTASPGLRASRSEDSAVISAVSGPMPRRTRLPVVTICPICAVSWFWAEVSPAWRRRTVISHGAISTATRPGCRLGQVDAVTRVEHDLPARGGALEVVQACKLGDEGGLGRMQQVARAPALRDLPELEDDHAPGERYGLLVGVGHDQHRDARVGDAGRELVCHLPASGRVECRERLVEQKQLRVTRERPGQRDPLALAARERTRPRLREMPDPDPLEQGINGHTRAVGDVPAHAHVRERAHSPGT